MDGLPAWLGETEIACLAGRAFVAQDGASFVSDETWPQN